MIELTNEKDGGNIMGTIALRLYITAMHYFDFQRFVPDSSKVYEFFY